MRNRNPNADRERSEDGTSGHQSLKTWVGSDSPRAAAAKDKKSDDKPAVVSEHDAVGLGCPSSEAVSMNPFFHAVKEDALFSDSHGLNPCLDWDVFLLSLGWTCPPHAPGASPAGN